MNRIVLFEHPLKSTPIVELSGVYSDNRIFVKREDLIPFSFGGNKVRKAAEYYREIVGTDTDLLMTCGSAGSNHCRVISNMAFSMGISCHLVSPDGPEEKTFNRLLSDRFGVTVETAPAQEISSTVGKRREQFRQEGRHPYLIMEGGHGIPGTRAYVKAYEEICLQQLEYNIDFDHIFHASGTGSTQAGLICGRLLQKAAGREGPDVIGISIARVGRYGKSVVRECVSDYLGKDFDRLFSERELRFIDTYRLGGYGNYNEEITHVIGKVMSHDGIPMDTTYVGKAFCGMLQYLREKKISGQNILFLHTGGTPFYFDYLRGLS